MIYNFGVPSTGEENIMKKSKQLFWTQHRENVDIEPIVLRNDDLENLNLNNDLKGPQILF